MWRPDTAASVGIERFDSQVVGEDQYDVGFVAWQMPGLSPGSFFPEQLFPIIVLGFEFLEGGVLFGRDLAVGVGIDMRK